MTRSLLTYDQVATWRRRLEDIAREQNELASEKQNIERKLEAVAILLGDEDLDDAPDELITQPLDEADHSTTKSASPRITWPGEMVRIFKEVRRPLTPPALKDLLDQGPLHGEYERSDKGFYHALSRLQKKGVLQKHRGWLFLADDLKKHLRKVEAGEIDDLAEVPANAQRRSPMGEMIKEYLEAHQNGVKSAEVIAHLKEDERFVDTLTKNSTGAYNVISRLAKRGEIRKEGTTLYPLKKNEPPKGDSEAEEAATSSNQVTRDYDEGPRDIFS